MYHFWLLWAVRSTLLLWHFNLHSFVLSYLISLLFAKVYVIHTRCASAIRDIEAFIESYMAHAVPSGLSKKKFSQKSLCNSRCAMGIWDAENFNKDYMAHAVSLVFDANFFLKSTNISLCAMSRLDLVTFQFSVGCRCAIGIVTKWCDFPPCDVTSLHLAIKLGDVTLRCVMWLKPGACSLCAPKTTTKQGSSSNKTDFCCSFVIFLTYATQKRFPPPWFCFSA